MIWYYIYEERDEHNFMKMKLVQLIFNVLKIERITFVSDFVLWQTQSWSFDYKTL
jgi:hypothetical protein